jgi:hypothetical protein
MHRSLRAVPWLSLCLLLASTASAQEERRDRQRPVTVGEHVEHVLETPHPYGATGTAEPVLVWSESIRHPEAQYVAVHFERFVLAPGDYVVVRDPKGEQRTVYRDLGRGELGLSENGFFATHVKGEEAVVELYAAGHQSAYGFRIDRYGRGFSDREIRDMWDQGVGEVLGLPRPVDSSEQICVADDTEEAKCFEDSEPQAYSSARAVARLLLYGYAHCTGWLVGTEGHLMTNQHCIGGQFDLDNVDFEFLAEGADCATSCNTTLGCPGTLEASGGTFVTSDFELDYALVLPDTSTHSGTDLAATYGHLTMRQDGPALGERIYMVHHPAGWGKRIGMTSSYPDDVTVGGFNYVSSLTEPSCSFGSVPDVGYWMDSQGGSSGSPVLGYADHKVVALHHCQGSGSCSSGNPANDVRNRGVPIDAVIDDLGPLLPQGAVCAAPPIPTDFVAVNGGPNEIVLLWNGGGPGVTHDVYRAVGACPQQDFELIATGVSGTTFTDDTVSADVPYAYRVQAYHAGEDCYSATSSCDAALTTGVCTQAPAFGGVTAVETTEEGCSLQVSWEPASGYCSQNLVYNVYRTLSGGAPWPVAACVTGTTFTDVNALYGLEYEYLVRAEDTTLSGDGFCTGGADDDNQVRVTGVVSGTHESFADDVESGSPSFAAVAGPKDPGGADPWRVVTSNSHSPTHSWFLPAPFGSSDQILELASRIPVHLDSQLEFWHSYDMESPYDGGVLEVLAGGTWTDIGEQRFLEGGYDWTLCCSTALGDRRGWSGYSSGWRKVTVDLSDFAGQEIRLRWRYGSDSIIGYTGWWVDDVRVVDGADCQVKIFADSFDSGNFVNWSAVVP